MSCTKPDVDRDPELDPDGSQFQIIVVGGVAAIAHGLARLTYDVDVVYSRADNIQRLIAALENHYPRGAPPGLPFRWNAETINAGLNFTMTTTAGDLALPAAPKIWRLSRNFRPSWRRDVVS